jgi:eukaryotic-like serine/threonine-protein kinase
VIAPAVLGTCPPGRRQPACRGASVGQSAQCFLTQPPTCRVFDSGSDRVRQSGEVSRAAAEVGSTANSYQILAKLATGGMAEIFLARGEGVAGVERYCVLKRILRDRASDVHFVRMFLDEARLAAQLQHPNIAQVYNIGKLGDSYFFTMEYVHGETVRALLHRAQGLRRKLPINGVLTIVAGAAAGLHHAHARLGFDGRALGIVHRDVSPSNLMVSYEGSVKLVDFGVAKAADRAQETKSGTVKGKISYLSPEQCKGKRVDRRSDLFSLGICFWEMLTTERLFKRASDFENMSAIVTEDTPPPSSRRPDVPPEIDELVGRLLAKSPDDRFQTADEVVDAIEGVAARTSTVLSASALGRFVRELFGQRPEPWLELEAHQEQGEAVTVTSEPIPRELAIAAAEGVDHQLASVLDLSSPPSVTESVEPVPLDVPTARVGKLSSLGFPLVAPPPTHPRIASAAGAAEAPATSTQTLPPSAGADLDSLPYVGSASPIPPGPDAYTPSSGNLVLPPPPVVSPSGPRPVPPAPAAPEPTEPRPAPHTIGTEPTGPPAATHTTAAPGPSGSLVTSPGASASFPAPSESLGGLRASTAYSLPVRRGVAWPLYVVIGSAALLGSVVVVLMMRSGSAPMVDAANAAKVTPPDSPARGAAARITVVPIPDPAELEVGPTTRAEPGSAVAPGAGPSAEDGVPRGSGHTGQAVGPPAPTRGTQPPARAPVPPRRPGGTAAIAAPRSGEATTKTPAPGRPREAGAPQDEEIGRLFAESHYDKVVALCSSGPVTAEHAPMCFIAACHAGNDAKARRFIGAVPAGRRDQLIMNCKQLGIDIVARPKPDKPVDDCEADPMSCQH